ncbi:MAG: PEP-CTERM sorting domain-containing protein [Phycisphaerae bacterium]
MRKFTLAVMLLAAASIAAAGTIDGTLEMTKSSGSSDSPVNLTTQGQWAWAYFATIEDADENGVYEPTEMKAGGPMITLSPGQSGEGGNSWGNPVSGDPQVVVSNHEQPEYFEWSDSSTDDGAGVTNDYEFNGKPATWRYDNPLGWVDSEVHRSNYQTAADGDPNYANTFEDYVLDSDYGFGELDILVPVPAGEGTVKVYFGTRRIKFLVDALLDADGETWISDLAGSFEGSIPESAKTNNVLEISYNADVAQDLIITFTGQNVYSDTNRRFDIQAVAVDAIPEPATMSLLALGGLAVLRRRRRA